MVTVAFGLGLRKREQLNLRRDQVDFSRNVVVATKTKGRKNRDIPMDVLDPEVREVLLKLCAGKKPDNYVFVNPETGKPFLEIKRSFRTACRLAGIEGLWWHDLRATFCTRLALAGYEALTIMTLMGHKDRRPRCVTFVPSNRRDKCVLRILSTNWPHKRNGRQC